MSIINIHFSVPAPGWGNTCRYIPTEADLEFRRRRAFIEKTPNLIKPVLEEECGSPHNFVGSWCVNCHAPVPLQEAI